MDQILPIIGYGLFTKPNVDFFAGLAGWLVPVLAPTVPVVRFGACPAPPTTPTPRGIAAGEAAGSPLLRIDASSASLVVSLDVAPGALAPVVASGGWRGPSGAIGPLMS